jgi:hypothetical protein
MDHPARRHLSRMSCKQHRSRYRSHEWGPAACESRSAPFRPRYLETGAHHLRSRSVHRKRNNSAYQSDETSTLLLPGGRGSAFVGISSKG